MASNQTQNYALPQWEMDDRIMLEDFNGAMETIDNTLSTKAELVFGTFTGNDNETRTISLGFTPKAVLLTSENGLTGYEASGKIYLYGGLALSDAPVRADSRTVLAIVPNGFTVGYDTTGNTLQAVSNKSSTVYHYMAVK